MLTHFGVESVLAEWPEAVACIGTFDGVHLGHRHVIGRAVELGRQTDRPSIVVTFDRHPAAILAPDRVPPAIATLGEDLRQFEALGVSAAVVLRFDAALAAMSAEEFLDRILQRALRATSLVVGHDFALGHERVGTPEWLSERIPTEVVPPFVLDGQRVASSEIRRLVAAGEVEGAAKLLGRPFAIEGVVVGGQKLGRTLGFPTLNLARSGGQVRPADGVYAGRCETSLGHFAAAIGVGVRPTVGGGERTIEAYLLDYPGDSLYGQAVRLEVLRRLRGEIRFDSLEDLRRQMASDVDQVRACIER
jgi:riboflavin kinase/FMN adenylyltransferase